MLVNIPIIKGTCPREWQVLLQMQSMFTCTSVFISGVSCWGSRLRGQAEFSLCHPTIKMETECSKPGKSLADVAMTIRQTPLLTTTGQRRISSSAAPSLSLRRKTHRVASFIKYGYGSSSLLLTGVSKGSIQNGEGEAVRGSCHVDVSPGRPSSVPEAMLKRTALVRATWLCRITSQAPCSPNLSHSESV